MELGRMGSRREVGKERNANKSPEQVFRAALEAIEQAQSSLERVKVQWKDLLSRQKN